MKREGGPHRPGSCPGVSEPRPGVSVCIVTHNSAADLPGCLRAVAGLIHSPVELVLVDCASGDGSADLASSLPAGRDRKTLRLHANLGFAGGMNRAIAASGYPYVLMLNPDARPDPGFLEPLLALMESEAGRRVGAATGRLRRLEETGDIGHLDACGMRLTPAWRHLDRGSGEVDRGQYSRPERVFGATGACSLFRREALEDAAIDGEALLEEFHSYREDAELCFRLRERGWEVAYHPQATAAHRRTNLPHRRAAQSPEVNFHSLKNRYLLRAYHQTWGDALPTLLPTLLRDAAALLWVLAAERRSLAAYRWLWTHRRRIASRRQTVRSRRRVGAWAIAQWFFRRGLPT